MNAPYVHIPETISTIAQDFLRALPDPAQKPRFPDLADLEGWAKLQAFAEADGRAKSAPLLARYPHSVQEETLGGIPVLDLRPEGWVEDGRTVVYIHGGAHVMYSATSSLGRAVVAAHATGHRIVSIDYTLAPSIRYDAMSDQVVTAIAALWSAGSGWSAWRSTAIPRAAASQRRAS